MTRTPVKAIAAASLSLATLVFVAMPACAEMQVPGQPSEPSEIRFVEIVMRNRAIRKVTPVYPLDSIKLRHHGVAVGEVTVNHAGKVTAVKVLQAPDDDIKASVASALRQWTFKPETIHGVPVDFIGTLTFYFEIKDGKSDVLNPDQMPRHK